MNAPGWILFPAICVSLILLGCTPIWIDIVRRYRLIRSANNVAFMRITYSRARQKAAKIQARKYQKAIIEVAKDLALYGTASTNDEFVATWYESRKYVIEKPNAARYTSSYKISIPNVSDKELSDIMLK